MATLVSIQVGQPTVHERLGRPWRTGFYKLPVSGPVWVGLTNVEGDGQSNLTVHGGPDKAVLAYAASHYPAWRDELSLPDLPYGAFAENLTVDGLDEGRVCIGDVFAIGPTRLEVTQPRSPCGNISRRWQIRDLRERVEQTGRSGWYQRVLHQGAITAGQPVELLERPHPEWTITRAALAMRRRDDDDAGRAEAALLASLPPLSAAWRATLEAIASHA